MYFCDEDEETDYSFLPRERLGIELFGSSGGKPVISCGIHKYLLREERNRVGTDILRVYYCTQEKESKCQAKIYEKISRHQPRIYSYRKSLETHQCEYFFDESSIQTKLVFPPPLLPKITKPTDPKILSDPEFKKGYPQKKYIPEDLKDRITKPRTRRPGRPRKNSVSQKPRSRSSSNREQNWKPGDGSSISKIIPPNRRTGLSSRSSNSETPPRNRTGMSSRYSNITNKPSLLSNSRSHIPNNQTKISPSLLKSVAGLIRNRINSITPNETRTVPSSQLLSDISNSLSSNTSNNHTLIPENQIVQPPPQRRSTRSTRNKRRSSVRSSMLTGKKRSSASRGSGIAKVTFYPTIGLTSQDCVVDLYCNFGIDTNCRIIMEYPFDKRIQVWLDGDKVEVILINPVVADTSSSQFLQVKQYFGRNSRNREYMYTFFIQHPILIRCSISSDKPRSGEISVRIPSKTCVNIVKGKGINNEKLFSINPSEKFVGKFKRLEVPRRRGRRKMSDVEGYMKDVKKVCNIPDDFKVKKNVEKRRIALPTFAYITKTNENLVDSCGLNALHYASAHGDVQKVEYLLKTHKFTVNKLDHFSHTALHFACYHSHTDVQDLLIQLGGLLSAKSFFKFTPRGLKEQHDTSGITAFRKRIKTRRRRKKKIEGPVLPRSDPQLLSIDDGMALNTPTPVSYPFQEERKEMNISEEYDNISEDEIDIKVVEKKKITPPKRRRRRKRRRGRGRNKILQPTTTTTRRGRKRGRKKRKLFTDEDLVENIEFEEDTSGEFGYNLRSMGRQEVTANQSSMVTRQRKTQTEPHLTHRKSHVRLISRYFGLLDLSDSQFPWSEQGGVVLENTQDCTNIIRIPLKVDYLGRRIGDVKIEDLHIIYRIERIGYFRGVRMKPSVSIEKDDFRVLGPHSGDSIFKSFKGTKINPIATIEPNNVLRIRYLLNNYERTKKTKGINRFVVGVFDKRKNMEKIYQLAYFFKKDNRNENDVGHKFLKKKALNLSSYT